VVASLGVSIITKLLYDGSGPVSNWDHGTGDRLRWANKYRPQGGEEKLRIAGK